MKRMVGIAVGLAVLLGSLVVPEGRAASQTLLSASSPGKPTKLKTRAFTVTGAWQVQWQYTCAKASGADFHVAVFTAAGQRAGLTDVHLQSKAKRGTQRYQVGGSFYLLVHSPCNWRLSVLGTRPAVPTATATPEPNLIDVSGSGSYTTENFSAPATGWKVHYTYDCQWGQVPGFFVEVGDARNPQRQPQAVVAETKTESGSGVSFALNGGQWFLRVQVFLSTCSWHIWVPKNEKV